MVRKGSMEEKERRNIPMYTTPNAVESRIVPFAYNISSIAAAKPGQFFMETDLAFPDDNTRRGIEVSRVTDHTGREENDRMDEIVKGATELELITEVTAVARHYGRLRKT